MILNNLKLQALKLGPKPRKLTDGNGLYLYCPAANKNSSSQHPAWRYDYRFAGKRYTLSLGTYPGVSIAVARDKLAQARRLILSGANPTQMKREEKLQLHASQADSFRDVADAWYRSKMTIRSEAWKQSHTLHLKRDLNPTIGSLPITQVDKRLLIAVLEKVKTTRGVKSADRVRQTALQVFEYAIHKTKAETNPAKQLRGWDIVPPKKSHSPLEREQIKDFFVRVDNYRGNVTTKICMELLMLTFVRKTELTDAKWEEFDFDQKVWNIPPERMKMKEAHVVPLSTQTVIALEALKPASLNSEFLFPSLKSLDKPMAHSTLNVAFARMGYGGTFNPHGVRATASTYLNEQGFRADVIERQLAHTERNSVRKAYNQASYMAERAAMMQAWADFATRQTEESYER